MVDMKTDKKGNGTHPHVSERYRTKKRFGQNFIYDRNVLEKIVRSAEIGAETGVIEIGPGLGSLTVLLAKSAKAVLAYEIDADLIPPLSSALTGVDNVIVLNRDFLSVDIDEDVREHLDGCAETIVVANLPYYITTPILMKVLETSKSISRLVVMMQEEVARRVTSEPSVKDYNALTVAIRYRASSRYLFRVPRTVFRPIPNVDSAVVSLTMDQKSENRVDDEISFFKLVHRCFSQRRKTIMNNLRDAFPSFDRSYLEQILMDAGIDPGCRAETLSVVDFIRLSKKLTPETGRDER
jgi:16S rRNA (adenine1518-N6/adenine1519-N6)-dimethyltransferase